MKRTALLGALAGLVVVQLGALLVRQDGPATPGSQVLWITFLVVIPLGLAAVVALRLRWAAMACVIYGTVGLALDLATAVQIVTKESALYPTLLSSGVSGLLNFLLIAFGGQQFLDVSPGPWPPESRPPNPPSSCSS